MQEIQSACAALARYPDSFVSRQALMIAQADLARDIEHDNRIVEMEASVSTLSAERKVLRADNRLLRAQLHKLTDMKFGQKSDKDRRKTKKEWLED